jgi:hypothetical protein
MQPYEAVYGLAQLGDEQEKALFGRRISAIAVVVSMD